MNKKIAIVLILFLLCSVVVPYEVTYASSVNSVKESNCNTSFEKSKIEDISVEALSKLKPISFNIPIQNDEEFISLWNRAKNKGYISVDKYEQIVINWSDTDFWDESNKTMLLKEILPQWNMAIKMGLLGIDPDKVEFYALQITNETIERITIINNSDQQFPAQTQQVMSFYDVGTICQNNDNTVKSLYNSLVYSQMLNPYAGIDPWFSTVSYWVGQVREGGSWDYKTQSAYSGSFNCSYSGHTNVIRNGEWLGNYNYGYTGKFLFSLDVLHTGSYIVSGFDPKDEETDWPAIDEGYADAP